MSRALYQDIHLSDDQIDRVRTYLRAVNFHLPGATCEDFRINPRARYLGYMFQAEDLESYGVGLACTAPGMENQNTFIRMSRGQLLGEAGSPVLPVNEPVLGAEAMTLNRFYDTPGGPTRHGIDTYSADAGLPGADMDLTMIETQLSDIVAFHNGQPVPGEQEILDLKIFWGTLLAGRFARLRHFAADGRLSPEQAARLDRLESAINSVREILVALDLPTLETLETTPVVDG
ncbi:hypothetical protein CATRI_05125 [Corynebacterium atrinae]|uniref:hypothetical protein n=1 Tax=Corynebacterium atrinae TaxID=1336740 RepID=UPI0025B57CCA|nr:hypothetical protein [Corynebacterium atrinae]WJY63117.1 hypothetical protein CATRI_05125 [Corynebacterium atrinae]